MKFNNGPTGAIPEYSTYRVTRKKFSIKKLWKRFYQSESDDSYNVPTNYPFMNYYHGWNIRIHAANGGHVVEVWKNNNDEYKIDTISNEKKHHLYVIDSSKNLPEELPKILTEIYLKDS